MRRKRLLEMKMQKLTLSIHRDGSSIPKNHNEPDDARYGLAWWDIRQDERKVHWNLALVLIRNGHFLAIRYRLVFDEES